ncbi:unnamed protein product [marine sediment metagenome]|uniref:Uncharacterized protein n=1 Tax=marine sediment metagenome TaxID=412755 RepID=X0VRB4_9ZZZZ
MEREQRKNARKANDDAAAKVIPTDGRYKVTRNRSQEGQTER